MDTLDKQAETMETIMEQNLDIKPRIIQTKYNLKMSNQGNQNTRIKVIAVPIKRNLLKLISLNQFEKTEINGYNQFDLPINRNLNETEEVQCIREISNYVINLNYVTILSLRSCGLRSLPIAMGIFPLKELDLMDNSLKHIPECLYYGLPGIETLNLSKNAIQHFNIAPKCCEVLKVLTIDHCQLNDVPWWIQEMKTNNLESLYFSCNKIIELKRTDWPQLPNRVNKLIFKNTGLRQNMLQFFKSFHLLEYLDLSNNSHENDNLIDDINDLLDRPLWLRRIKVLKLNNLCINELSENVCQLNRLTELQLSNNSLLNLPQDICNLKELLILDISQNYIYALPDLSSLNKLEELHASKNHLSSLSIANMPRLKYVDLYINDLENLDLDASIVEFIDLEQNCVDGDVLANCDNYAEKRDKFRHCKLTQFGSSWRIIGRKLNDFDLEETGFNSPNFLSVHVDVDDPIDIYSDKSDDEHDGNDKLESEDGSRNDENQDQDVVDDCSDWDESWSNDFVTLSDSEFNPDEETTLSAIPPAPIERNIQSVRIDIENLFIDAD